MYRIAIPLIAECPFVWRCLRVLRSVLPPPLALQVLVKWYGIRNAPGTADLSPMHEWSMLCTVLAELIGRPLNANATSGVQHAPKQQHRQRQQRYSFDCSDRMSFDGRIAGNQTPVAASTSTTPASNLTATPDAEPKKRRKSENCQGTDNDWEYLLRYVDRCNTTTSTAGYQNASSRNADAGSAAAFARYDPTAPLFAKLPLVFYALHLFYEERKLFGVTATQQRLHHRSLGELLYQLSMDLQLDGYGRHYFLDQPTLIYVQSASLLSDAETKLMSNVALLGGAVPNVFRCLHDAVAGAGGEGGPTTMGRVKYPHLAEVNDRSRDIVVVSFYKDLFTNM